MRRSGGGGRHAPFLLAASLGFFSIAAQTLLFRDFLSAFEGTELAIGLFFASWFLWIAVGAALARRCGALAGALPMLSLLYLPGYVLEHHFILAARGWAGVAAYEAFPYASMFALSLIATVPVSFITGFLFALACRWWEQ